MKTRLLLVSLIFLAGTSYATDKPTTNTPYPAMTTDMRSKMADMHQQMATCLKSTKTFEECHSDMANSCHEFGLMMPMMGNQRGMMQGHRGMMEGKPGMMGGYPGMMTGFCGDQWLNKDSKESKDTKTKK